MSWAEVHNINNNFKKPINEQIRELAYNPSYLFTTSTSFAPEKNGWYKVIVVGSGGASWEYSKTGNYYYQIGASGGVAVSTRKLLKSSSYSISIYTENYTKSASFAGNIIAHSANNTVAGTAEGGDFNFSGLSGRSGNLGSFVFAEGVDVGVVIPALHKSFENQYGTSGQGILGYGASGGIGQAVPSSIYAGHPDKQACVLIIPLEFEE